MAEDEEKMKQLMDERGVCQVRLKKSLEVIKITFHYLVITFLLRISLRCSLRLVSILRLLGSLL